MVKKCQRFLANFQLETGILLLAARCPWDGPSPPPHFLSEVIMGNGGCRGTEIKQVGEVCCHLWIYQDWKSNTRFNHCFGPVILKRGGGVPSFSRGPVSLAGAVSRFTPWPGPTWEPLSVMTDVTDGSVVCADTSEVETDLPATVPIATATASVSLATVIY